MASEYSKPVTLAARRPTTPARLGPCSLAASPGSTEWQAKHLWNWRSPRTASPPAARAPPAERQPRAAASIIAAARGAVTPPTSVGLGGGADHAHALGARFRDPCLALASQHLP